MTISQTLSERAELLDELVLAFIRLEPSAQRYLIEKARHLRDEGNPTVNLLRSLDSTDRVVDQLSADLRALREEFEAYRRSMAAEVRTRGVVVLDEDGFDRITLRTTDASGEVAIHSKEVEDMRVVLFANEESRDPVAGLTAGPAHGTYAEMRVDTESLAYLGLYERNSPNGGFTVVDAAGMRHRPLVAGTEAGS